MIDQLGKTQFSATEETPVISYPPFGLAMDAAISDGDFRTYVLLCQLAFQEHPEAVEPFTERSYVEMAELHPGRRRPTPATVRGRLYRLARAGLVKRRRAGRTVWRTYPQLEEGGAILLGGPRVHTQTVLGGESQHTQTLVDARAQHTQTPLGEEPEHTQTPLGGEPQRTQTSGRAQGVHPDPVGARQEHTQPPRRAPGAHPEPLGGEPQHTQAPLSGQPEHTQTPLSGEPQHTQTSGRAQGAHPDAVGGQPEHTQTPGRAPGAHPSPDPSRARASVLTDPDSLSDPRSSTSGRDLSTDQISTEASPPKDLPDHPVFRCVLVPKGLEELALTLATLSPQGMNYEGIDECLAAPERTQAWLDYVRSHPGKILKPAAYIRFGVRSGHMPPQAKQPADQPTPKPKPRLRNTYGWNDPNIPPELYAKYKFDAVGCTPPELLEKYGLRPKGDTPHAH